MKLVKEISATGLALVLAVCVAHSFGQEETGTRGSLSGTVVDAADAPVVGSAVILCDGETGIPLSAKAHRTLADTILSGGSPMDVAFALTDENGRFKFQEIPLGRYSLLAQSWPGENPIKGIFEVNGSQVELRGVARDVVVSEDSTPEITLRPLGSGVLHVDEQVGNDGAFLVIGTAPPRADPVLGFVGWGGEFSKNIIGGNRMPKGVTEIRGLPEGQIHAVVFANDDSPGWGAGEAEIRAGVTTVTYIPIVAGWSDAHHDPPRRLEGLVKEIEALDDLPNTLESNGIVLDPIKGIFSIQQQLSRHLETQVTLPSGRKTHGADLLAAVGYVRLAEAISKRQQRRKRPEASAGTPGTPATYTETIEDLHREIGQKYPCFQLKGIDWQAVGQELLPRAEDCQDDEDFCHLCLELVARLEDSHATLLKGTAQPAWPTLPSWDPGFACLIDDRGQPVVYYLDKNGPAESAGLKIGMTVLSVNDKPSADAIQECAERTARYFGYSSRRYLDYQAARWFARQSQRGGKVSLKTRDSEGDVHEFVLSATLGVRYLPRLPVPIDGISDSAAVSWKLLEDGIGYIYVRRIRGELIESLDRAVAELADARGLIVDVRGNSGGGFDDARSHRNFALDDTNEPERPRFAGPIALLIDSRCVSAGEGWASWFIANQRAKVFGQATAGASARKTVYTLKNGLYQVRFPIKAYSGFLDRPIERRGLEPDVPLRQTAADLAAGRDTVLETAKQYLRQPEQ